jgi:Zn-dependent M28 family amino/carboxypeptidase
MNTAAGDGPRALRRHVETLAGSIGERNLWRYDRLQRAAEYVESELRASGHDLRRQTYDVSQLPVSNVEATLTGTTRPQEILVLGAHYDSVPECPGANDNATGVAVVLELARRFARRPHARTIRFVGFVNEEPPFFQTAQMGSMVYAAAARRQGDRIVGMLCLETMGYYSDARDSQQYPVPMGWLYPDAGNFIGFVSNFRSARLLMRVRAAFKARTSFPFRSAALPSTVPGVAWSDHWAFWETGYPAVMVTDTAPYRYPWYHTPEDTPDKIAYDRLAHVVDGLEHVTAVLAGAPPAA